MKTYEIRMTLTRTKIIEYRFSQLNWAGQFTAETHTSDKSFFCDKSWPQFKAGVAYVRALYTAVAFKVGKLKELSEEYNVPLSQMVTIPGGSGTEGTRDDA